MAKRKSQDGPQFVRFFGPLLDALRELGGSGTPDEAVEQIATALHISDDEQDEKLPSGQPRFKNQVAWARFYLYSEGLLESSKRGVWSLTEKGRSTSLTHQQAKDLFLKWATIFRKAKSPEPGTTAEQLAEESITPSNNFHENHLEQLREQIIGLMLSLPASGFERLAQRILREAGFKQVIVTGKSGDGGIDGHGTLEINSLLSFRVLFQCKRYSKSVAPTHVRDFRGAMAGRADKGIIITTGSFSPDARREASRDGVPPIELIDGEKLVDLLIQMELGLKPITTYEVDQQFFNEFR